MNAVESRPLTADEIEAFGAEVDALRAEVLADLGQADVDHIRGMMRLQRRSEAAGRLLLAFGFGPLTFVGGAGALALAKILENMEIGHNVMHGQYDWTGDPELQGLRYEWDNVCTGDNWRHYHNVEHHTYTNILGKDRDIGYDLLRVTAEQPWRPGHLVQPLSALALAALFQWGVGMHDLRPLDPEARQEPLGSKWARWSPFLRKAGWQIGKDYVFYPVLAFWNAPRVLLGNLLANGTRNVWAFSVIFCGHFPDGVAFFEEETLERETRGGWYLRQLNGSVNFDGPRWMHILSGHLSHQIEHHLFPDIPAHRYPTMSMRMREICERYGQAYNTGSLPRQLWSVARNIVRLSLPGGRAGRPTWDSGAPQGAEPQAA
ncbi:MAG: acyl-CoA desaturase [Deltaproteobacteria bacterium]|nr:MAG: acyl-CoA desaturase [Deltaproteobacteria bacterium]